jgi:hypothetical protein
MRPLGRIDADLRTDNRFKSQNAPVPSRSCHPANKGRGCRGTWKLFTVEAADNARLIANILNWLRSVAVASPCGVPRPVWEVMSWTGPGGDRRGEGANLIYAFADGLAKTVVTDASRAVAGAKVEPPPRPIGGGGVRPPRSHRRVGHRR